MISISRALLVSAILAAAIWVGGCDRFAGDAPALSRESRDVFRVGEHRPEGTESATVGAIDGRISRGSPAFERLVRDEDSDIVYKDEEHTGADRMMTPRLRSVLHRLDERVRRQWPGLTLRVTEAWDERGEHGPASLHYEGRAADVTTSDVDPSKLGKLAELAVGAGDWVLREDSHVHLSVRR